ncbi:hypothetical protein ACU635_55285 [[Actinomadura] parvosata]|uniref:hypothetical protein n=1 Tax=[Actinomadura] parvosata TaxID=1955412 RepID=UPI00406C58C6
MNHADDAQAGLAEIAKRRDQVLDGASRGRHRGWDAAGMVLMVAGFAAMDLPMGKGPQLALLLVALVAALACFTQAGRRSRAVLHASALTGRFWAVLGGCALAAGALVLATVWLIDGSDFPLRNTVTGVVLAVIVAAGEPLYRALVKRRAAA